jgi:hypothetical protein
MKVVDAPPAMSDLDKEKPLSCSYTSLKMHMLLNQHRVGSAMLCELKCGRYIILDSVTWEYIMMSIVIIHNA